MYRNLRTMKIKCIAGIGTYQRLESVSQGIYAEQLLQSFSQAFADAAFAYNKIVSGQAAKARRELMADATDTTSETHLPSFM